MVIIKAIPGQFSGRRELVMRHSFRAAALVQSSGCSCHSLRVWAVAATAVPTRKSKAVVGTARRLYQRHCGSHSPKAVAGAARRLNQSHKAVAGAARRLCLIRSSRGPQNWPSRSRAKQPKPVRASARKASPDNKHF